MRDESHLPAAEQSLVFRLRKRAEIRRQIPGRKSAEEGTPDRIADLLEEAANRIHELEQITAESYQVIGVLATECGRFDDPAVIKALDNTSLQELCHDDVLPFPSKER